jgi:tRNA-dihydrouridine synthase B
MNFRNKVMLAPLAAVNNIAFRKLCTELGADIVYSQMIDARAYAMGNRRMTDFCDEKNVVAQFFGNDGKMILQCAREVEKKVQAIDINLGCPHSNVVKRRCGSYLMKYPDKVRTIVRRLVRGLDLPVTVKIRAGYDKHNINAADIAKLCEKEGVSAIAVHGRARTVNYAHAVDYGIIKDVKASVGIPVIGNGDIFSGEDAKKMYDETGCDSVMVGRGAIGNPSIFREIKVFLQGKKSKTMGKKRIFIKYLRYAKNYDIPFKDVKRQAQWFTKGITNGGELRRMLNDTKSSEEIMDVYEIIDE